jgi:hypothetical protein
MRYWTLPFLLLSLLSAPLAAADLEIKQGDHICFVGNTLAERMQHFNHFEARLVSRFGKEDLTIRNIAFSADELNIRLRSANFGSPDDWL